METTQDVLVQWIAALPRLLPDRFDRRSMWERIPAVLRASSRSEESFPKVLEAVARRLGIRLDRAVANPAWIKVCCSANDWCQVEEDEALRELAEETVLLVTLARAQYVAAKAAAKGASK